MPSSTQVEMLTTLGCHLCGQAEAMLLRVNPQLEIIRTDIAEDDTLIALYGERIPVVRYGDRELGWPFSLLDLQRLLAHQDGKNADC